ncbi:MAG: PAS domain-containing protein [Pseudomonadota bacterium]
MADDERLRETLLELQMLRDREASLLQETRNLAECLEAYSQAGDPSSALVSIFVSLQQKMGAQLSLLVERGADDRLEIVSSSNAALVGTTIETPVDLFARARNVSDMALLGIWQARTPFDPYAGLLVAPASTTISLLTMRERPAKFSAADFDLVQRLAGLAGQAFVNSKIASENKLLAATISGSSSGFAISDATRRDNPLVYVNAAFEKLSGYSADEVLGQNCRFLTAEDHDAPERKRLRNAVAKKEAGTFLLRNQRKDKTQFWNELTLYPVRNERGDVINLVATQTDVSARVAATQDRDRITARMERALATGDDAFLLIDPDDTIAFANDAVRTFFEAPGHAWAQGTNFRDNWEAYLEYIELLGRPIAEELITPELRALAKLSDGRELELPDGRIVLVRARNLDDGGLVVSATDVTARLHSQKLLSQRLAAIEASKEGILIADLDGRITYINSAGAELMGFPTPSDGLGSKWMRRYDGDIQPQAAEEFELTLDRASVGERQVHEISGSPLPGGGALIVARDITDSLAFEEREAQMMRDLIRLQRQEAVAQLTAGVAHDFNNYLSVINGSTTLMTMSGDLSGELEQHVNRISQASQQSAKLVTRLLDMGASSETHGAFDLKSVITDLPTLLQPSLPKKVRFNLTEDVPNIALRGNPSGLNQILMNLALNAFDAMPAEGGQVTLTAKLIDGPGEHDAHGNGGRLDTHTKYAVLTVSDTGSGMDTETLQQATQPYFTTKGRQGSGLGLAMAAMQAQAVGGAIRIKSEPGVGTDVSVYWPPATSGHDDGEQADAPPAIMNGMTLLVVDDDEDVSAVMAAFLEARGAEVAVCQDPRDALSAITEDPDGWSALITDYDMPIMDGGALVTEVRQQTKNLPIFVVTALARRLNDPRLEVDSIVDILPKPVDLEHLAAKITEVATNDKD